MSLNLMIFISFSASFLIINELIKRKFLFPVYVTRKVAHIGAALIACATPYFLSREEIILLSILFTAVLLSTRPTKFFSSIQAINRDSLGELFLPLGVIICAWFFLPDNVKSFQFGVLIMGISDGLAGLIGEKFGKHYFNFVRSRKSIEGTCVFFITSFILTSMFFPVFDYRVVLIPLILVVVEFFLEYGLDNLVLPVVAAYLISFLV